MEEVDFDSLDARLLRVLQEGEAMTLQYVYFLFTGMEQTLSGKRECLQSAYCFFFSLTMLPLLGESRETNSLFLPELLQGSKIP